MSKPQQAVQAAHAAIESTKRWPYLLSHPHLVLLGVDDVKELIKAKDLSKEYGISTADFFEGDNDGRNNGGFATS